MALVGEAKAISKARKATVDYNQLKYDIDEYLRTNGDEYWRELFTPLIEGVIADQTQEWASVLGMEFDVRNLAAESWFQKYTLQFAQPITQTSSDGIHAVIEQGLAEGWAIPTMQSHIEQLFIQWMNGGATAQEFDWYSQRLPPHRTEMISRTETMHASNTGSYYQMSAWKIGFKGWLASIDGRERDTHRVATMTYDEGGSVGIIPMSQPFVVGGYHMQHPGDSSMGAAVGEIVNCRCTILPYTELPKGQDQFGNISQRISKVYDSYGRENARDQLNKAFEESRAEHQAITDKLREIEGKIDKLGNEHQEILKKAFAPGIDMAERDALLLKGSQIRDKMDKMEKRRYDMRMKARDMVAIRSRAALEYGNEADISVSYRKHPGLAGGGSQVKSAVDFLRAIFTPDSFDLAGSNDISNPVEIKFKKNVRANASEVIEADPTDTTRVYVHEYGHIFEHRNQHAHELAVQFLEYRTQGEDAVSLADMFPRSGYRSHEVVKKDKFTSAYTGSIYKDSRGNYYGSEIISMGLQQLYGDPYSFARDDPEYFDFMIGLLRGWL